MCARRPASAEKDDLPGRDIYAQLGYKRIIPFG